jgi:hypothetical protein
MGVYAWYQEFEFEICLYFFLNFKQNVRYKNWQKCEN